MLCYDIAMVRNFLMDFSVYINNETVRAIPHRKDAE